MEKEEVGLRKGRNRVTRCTFTFSSMNEGFYMGVVELAFDLTLKSTEL